MLTHGAMRECDLTSLVVCSNDKFCDIRERNVTVRSEIWTTNIRSLGFWDIRECMTLWGLILRSLGCNLLSWQFERGWGYVGQQTSSCMFPQSSVKQGICKHRPHVFQEVVWSWLLPGLQSWVHKQVIIHKEFSQHRGQSSCARPQDALVCRINFFLGPLHT